MTERNERRPTGETYSRGASPTCLVDMQAGRKAPTGREAAIKREAGPRGRRALFALPRLLSEEREENKRGMGKKNAAQQFESGQRGRQRKRKRI